MSYDPRVHVGVAVWVTNAVGDLLMVRRAGTSGVSRHGHGTWSVPGGWVDYGETVEAAAIRELREETGLATDAAYLRDVVSNTHEGYGDEDLHVVCAFLEVTTWAGVPRNLEPEKADAVEWVPLTRVVSGELPLFAPLATYLRRNAGISALLRDGVT